MTHRPFRFGIQASAVTSRTEWLEVARRAEGHGYDVLTLPDHFTPQLAPVPAMMAAADATTRLRVGALVLDNDYRHPLVLAKELATVDVLSEGRLEIGLGAGWLLTDYEQAGMTYDSPKVRIDRLVEALAVVKGLMGDGAFTFEGEHYRISEHDALPKPVQRPHPPILVGGGGRRVLRIAAREADIVGINPTLTAGAVGTGTYDTMSAEAFDAKVSDLLEAAGDRRDAIELNVRVYVAQVTDHRSVALRQLAQATGASPDDVAASPYALVGTTQQIVDDLLARRERWGISYLIVGSEVVDAFAPVVAELAGR